MTPQNRRKAQTKRPRRETNPRGRATVARTSGADGDGGRFGGGVGLRERVARDGQGAAAGFALGGSAGVLVGDAEGLGAGGALEVDHGWARVGYGVWGVAVVPGGLYQSWVKRSQTRWFCHQNMDMA